MSLDIHSTAANENTSRLAELESSLQLIQSDRDSMQSDHKQLRNDLQVAIRGHSTLEGYSSNAK
jgi:hypothetical protein